ncbi:MAG: MoxR family ATPase, partial [Firmicutes bacterium]|nr:MoxR family ATPase [Bacillota bacterium]
LADFQVTIPEFGTVTANHRPYVVITSNRMRELSDALKRRCLYLYLDYPDEELERAIINLRLPGVTQRLTADIVHFVQQLRRLKLKKAPSIAESLDWARTLLLLERDSIDPELVRETLNVLLKYEDDIQAAAKEIPSLAVGAGVAAGPAGGVRDQWAGGRPASAWSADPTGSPASAEPADSSAFPASSGPDLSRFDF